MSITFNKLAEFLVELKKTKFENSDYCIVYVNEEDTYSYLKKSDLHKFTYKNDYINVVGVLRKNVITNELYFTRWEELTPSEQDVLFSIIIKIKNRYENNK